MINVKKMQIKLSSYKDRLERVTDHIYDNLDQDIDLNHLAEVACMSPFHWHRIYHAVYGETIAATVRRLRLARAAADLTNTVKPVKEIAEHAGFKNLQAFSRLFKQTYGLPPASYRERGNHTIFERSINEEDPSMYDMEIKDFDRRRVASIPHKGPYINIGQTFDKMFGALGGRPLDWSKTFMIGIYYDDPSSVPENELRSAAGVIVNDDFDMGDDLEETHIEQGRCAVLHYKGPYTDMQKAYNWLFGTWLVSSGEEAGNEPCFEVYLNNPREVSPQDLLTDIYLPLK